MPTAGSVGRPFGCCWEHRFAVRCETPRQEDVTWLWRAGPAGVPADICVGPGFPAAGSVRGGFGPVHTPVTASATPLLSPAASGSCRGCTASPCRSRTDLRSLTGSLSLRADPRCVILPQRQLGTKREFQDGRPLHALAAAVALRGEGFLAGGHERRRGESCFGESGLADEVVGRPGLPGASTQQMGRHPQPTRAPRLPTELSAFPMSV